MNVQKLDVQVLVDNVSGPGGTIGESGFSALVKVLFTDSSKLTLLFDSGPSPKAFLNNVKELKIDLTSIDAIILSHGHWDHVGGLREAIKMSKKRIPLICHPQALSPKILVEKGKTIDVGIQEFFESVDDLKEQAKLILTTAPYRFNASVMTTGEVPRRNDYEKLTGRLAEITTIKDGNTVFDVLEDDLSLVFHLADDSVVILAGCCHAGIVNTVRLAAELTGSDKITGIIGGLHLTGASYERLSKTVLELEKYPVKVLAPCHCTGLRGKSALLTAFDKRFQEAIVSTTITFKSGKNRF
ncbi:MAG: MBL fold metallo-hydrolase [Candidatus Odinarchaeota archaeon]